MLSHFNLFCILFWIALVACFLFFAWVKIHNSSSSTLVTVLFVLVCVGFQLAHNFFFIVDHSDVMDGYYNIVEEKQLEDYTISKVELPYNDYEWIVIGSEPVSDDGNKVMLQLKQSFNRHGDVIFQTVLYTTIYTGKVVD